jgi:hypothetical protein
MSDIFKRPPQWFLLNRTGDREEQFKLAQQKAMEKKKFPPEFELPVNMQAVNLEVVKPWISKKVKCYFVVVLEYLRRRRCLSLE